MADHVGQQLGNYQLRSLLGKGGFAEVYLGEHIYLKSKAAIKLLSAQLTIEDKEHFLAEARLLVALNHPYIVRVLEFGVEGDIPFLVMDYAPNGSLRQHHPKGVRVPLMTTVSYVKQVAAALQYAHDEKLIHRDVKPENMLVGRHNEVLLSDFGIALMTQTSRNTKKQDVVGTISYMAPEQISAHACPASDQYSLGIVLYEWLSGDRPFQGSFTEIAVKHTLTPPPPLREKVPTLSPAVEQVVLTALAKDPKDRFTTVRAFADALEQACVSIQPSLREESVAVSIAALPTIPLSSLVQPSVTPLPLQRSQQHNSSRRNIVVGLVAVALVATTGTAIGALTILNGRQGSALHNQPTPTKGSATATPDSTPPVATQTPTAPANSDATATPHGTQPLVTTKPGTTLFTYHGHAAQVNGVAWSPNGLRIVSGSDDYTVQGWNASDGSNTHAYSANLGLVEAVAWSPDGSHVAATGGGPDVWNAATGNHLYTYSGHSLIVYAVAWSPNSLRGASASADGTVQVWDAATGNHIYTYRGHANGASGVAWSPNGARITSTGADGTVQVWDATTGGNVLTHTGGAAVAWSPDGLHIASANTDGVQVWNATTGMHIYTYQGHLTSVNALAWAPNSLRIASAGRDATVQVWDATTGSNALVYHGHTRAVNALAWSPDGARVASASTDVTVQVWQAR